MALPFIIFIGFFLIKSLVCKIDLMTGNMEHRDLHLEWNVISNFMEDQYLVALFVEQHYDDYGDKLLKYSIKDGRFGVFNYNNVTLLFQFWKSLEKENIFTNRIYGAVIIVRDLNLIDSLVKASVNNKLVLVFFNLDVDAIKTIMHDIWNRHKHFTLITLLIHYRDGNKFIQHNPFKSKFFVHPINEQNMSSANFALYLNDQFKVYLHNMAGYGIRVFMFDFPLVSVLKRNETGYIIDYEGVDGQMMALCKQFMNFTPIFVNGPIVDPTNFSGISIFRSRTLCRRRKALICILFSATTISLIDEGQAEIGMNARFISDNPYHNTIYMYPIDAVALHFIVPINYELAPLTILAYYCFDRTTKVIISITLMLLLTLWWFGTYMIKENVECATSAILFRVFGIFHGIALNVPKKIFNRIIFITIAFFGLLMMSVYQGTIIQQLNSPLTPHQIDSLNDLLNSNLNISIMTYVKPFSKNDSRDPDRYFRLMGEIGRKPILQYDGIFGGLDVVAYNKTSAYLIPILFYSPFSPYYFNETTGLNLLHVIKEPVASTFISWVISRNSPYIRVFHYVSRIYVENGIMIKEIKKAVYTTQLTNIQRIRSGHIPKDKNRFRPITLEDMVMINYFLVINAAGSIVLLVLEICVNFIYTKFVRTKICSNIR